LSGPGPVDQLSADLGSETAGGRLPAESADRASRVLEAKYLDWCSARLADRFLRLSPDEIYALAEEGSPGDAVPPGELAALVTAMHHAWADAAAAGEASAGAGAADPSWPSPVEAAGADAPGRPAAAFEAYRAVVARVAGALAVRVGLPTFEEWGAAYQEDPARFDPELVGFWRDEV
jgi:hypothetical protein